MFKNKIYSKTFKNHYNNICKPVLNSHDVRNCLTSLHDKFVICVADKAANNFVIFCKKYYLEVLCKELGINNYNILGNSTYKYIINNTAIDIVKNVSDNCKKFSVTISKKTL